MSKSVDERIVQMSFENKNFEKNVSATIDSLEKLKKSLKLNNSDIAADFEEISSVSSKANNGINALDSSTNKVGSSFNALHAIAFGALTKIGEEAYATGKRMLKSFTLDNFNAGWQKYADITTSTKTIMASITEEFDSEAEKLSFVTGQLERLNWFTDETSYNLVDMVNNVGKFTANSVDLEDAVDAMQGISTWAAISGQNTEAAGRAMYNLSQAMSVGKVQLMDWRSIENANMATAEFKQTAIDAAVALGTLKKDSNGVITTLDKTIVTADNMATTLNKGWFTSDVLLNVLGQYGKFATRMYEVSELTGLTASEMLENIDSFKEGTLDLSTLANETGLSLEELQTVMEELSGDEYDLGRRAFKASQEARTFRDAINSVKDAVSTQWMNSFKYIFGDPNEATELWTNVANELYDIFTKTGEQRNAWLEEWYNAGGRDELLSSLSTIYESLGNIGKLAKVIFSRFFPDMESNPFILLTNGITKFADKLKSLLNITDWETVDVILNGNQRTKITTKYTEWQGPMAALAEVFKAVFGAGRLVVDILKALSSFSFTSLSSFIGSVASAVEKFENWVVDSGIIGKIVERLKKISENFAMAIQKIVGAFGELMAKAYNWLKDNKIFEKIGNGILNFVDIFSESVVKWSDSLVNWLENSEFIKDAGNAIGKAIDWLSEKVSSLYKTIKIWLFGSDEVSLKEGFLSGLAEGAEKDKENAGAFQTIWSSVSSGVSWIVKKVPEIWKVISDFFTQIWNTISQSEIIDKLWTDISGFFEKSWPAIQTFFSNIWNAFKEMLAIDASGIEDWRERLTTKFKPFEKIGDWFKTLGENLFVSGEELKATIKSAWENIRGFFKGVWDIFYEWFSNIDWKTVVESLDFTGFFRGIGEAISIAFKSLSIFIPKKELEDGTIVIDLNSLFNKILGGFAAFSGVSLLSGIAGLTKNAGKFLSSVKDFINAIRQGKILDKKAKDTKPFLEQLGDLLLKMAGSVAIIAGSLIAVGLLLNEDQMKNASTNLGLLFLALGTIVLGIGLADKFSGGSISKIGTVFTQLAGSLAIMTITAVVLSKIRFDTLLVGLLKLALILGTLLTITTLASLFSRGSELKAPFVKLALAVGICAVIVGYLGKMRIGQSLKGVLGLALILGSLAGAMTLVGHFTGHDIKAPFVKLALAVGICAVIVGYLGKMNPVQGLQGVFGLMLILGTLVGAVVLMNKFSAGSWKGVAQGVATMATVIVGVGATALIFYEMIKGFKNLGVGGGEALMFAGALESIMLVSAAINIAYAKLNIGPKKAGAALASSLLAMGLPLAVGTVAIIIGELGSQTINGTDMTNAEKWKEDLETAKDLFDKINEVMGEINESVIDLDVNIDPDGKFASLKANLNITKADIWGIVGLTGGFKRAFQGIAAQSVAEIAHVAVGTIEYLLFNAIGSMVDVIDRFTGEEGAGLANIKKASEALKIIKETMDEFSGDIVSLSVDIDPEGKISSLKTNFNLTSNDIIGVIGAVNIKAAMMAIGAKAAAQLADVAVGAVELAVFTLIGGLINLSDEFFGEGATISALEDARDAMKVATEIVDELGTGVETLASHIGGAIGKFFGSLTGSYTGARQEAETKNLPEIATNLATAVGNFAGTTTADVTNFLDVLEAFTTTTVKDKALINNLGYLSGSTFKDALEQIGTGLSSIPMGLEEKAESIKTFMDFLVGITKEQEIPSGSKLAKNTSVVDKIKDVSAAITGTDFQAVVDFANSVSTVGPDAANGIDNLVAFIDKLNPSGVQEKMSSFINIIVDAVSGEASSARFTEAGTTVGERFGDGINSWKDQSAKDCGSNLSLAVRAGIASKSPSNEGIKFAYAFINAIKSVRGAAYNAGRDLVNSVGNGLRWAPSGEDIPYYKGVAVVDSFADGLQNESKSIANSSFNALNSVAGAITNISTSGAYTPTIYPVVDASSINAASQGLNSLFSEAGQVNMTVTGYEAFNSGIQSAGNLVSDLSGLNMDNVSVVEAVNNLGVKLDELEDAIVNLQLVMDTGVVAGQLAPKIDKNLAARVTYKGRGG